MQHARCKTSQVLQQKDCSQGPIFCCKTLPIRATRALRIDRLCATRERLAGSHKNVARCTPTCNRRAAHKWEATLVGDRVRGIVTNQPVPRFRTHWYICAASRPRPEFASAYLPTGYVNQHILLSVPNAPKTNISGLGGTYPFHVFQGATSSEPLVAHI